MSDLSRTVSRDGVAETTIVMSPPPEPGVELLSDVPPDAVGSVLAADVEVRELRDSRRMCDLTIPIPTIRPFANAPVRIPPAAR
jgi:hypothetical protein